jgi:hypothetical protein
MSETMQLVRKDDGVWLHLSTPSGNYALINLSVPTNSPIVHQVLDELAPDPEVERDVAQLNQMYRMRDEEGP